MTRLALAIARLKAAQARAAYAAYLDAGGQVTPCPPGAAQTASATFIYHGNANTKHSGIQRAARRMVQHCTDDTGEAIPVRSQRSRRRDGHPDDVPVTRTDGIVPPDPPPVP